MDFETVSPEDFGRSLKGIGVNLVTADVPAMAQFLVDIFGLSAHQISDDFAIVIHDGMIIQLHHDGTYHSHPLQGMLPENPPRGTGLQIYLFGVDPDAAQARAEAAGVMVLEQVADKPHGLREGTILSAEGYAFSAAVRKAT